MVEVDSVGLLVESMSSLGALVLSPTLTQDSPGSIKCLAVALCFSRPLKNTFFLFHQSI